MSKEQPSNGRYRTLGQKVQPAASEICFANIFYIMSSSKLLEENRHFVIWWSVCKSGDHTDGSSPLVSGINKEDKELQVEHLGPF